MRKARLATRLVSWLRRLSRRSQKTARYGDGEHQKYLSWLTWTSWKNMNLLPEVIIPKIGLCDRLAHLGAECQVDHHKSDNVVAFEDEFSV